jgi:hypothetical protein
MEALRRGGATWAWLDLGGQVAVSGKEVVVSIAHPAERGTAALELVLGAGSASTTGNSERAASWTASGSATCSTRAAELLPGTSAR